MRSLGWRQWAVVACITSGVLGLTCISAGAATGEVPRTVVQTQAEKVLAAETGRPLPTVKCPGGLPGTVGAHITCTLTAKGSSLKYPVRVTVSSISNGTAHFEVQVGQAPGQANKAKFCADNAAVEKATSAAKTTKELLSALSANQKTILNFQATAPAAIVDQAAILVQASRQAVLKKSTTPLSTSAVANAGTAVDRFCGVKASPVPSGG
jgi:hypothetical protein